MKKKSIWLISVLMTLALLGVFVMQLYYIKEAYNLKLQLFEQNVNQALTEVVKKAQKRKAVTHINNKDKEILKQKENNLRTQTDIIVAFKERFKENENLRKFKQQQLTLAYLNNQDSTIRADYYSPYMISEEQYKTFTNVNVNQNQGIQLIVNDTKDKDGRLRQRRIIPNFPILKQELQLGRLPDTIRYFALSPENMLPRFISFPSKDRDLAIKFKIENAKEQLKYQMELERLYADTANLYSGANYSIVQAVTKEMQELNIPLYQRIPAKEILDTLIKRELQNKNITLNYSFWLTPANNKNQIIYENVANANLNSLPQNTFKHTLFTSDVIRDPGMLYVYFPTKSSLIFSNMFVTTASSAGLLLVLIFIFTYTIYAILKQKKIAEMKSDFINNMTHEFKTPVATIMIASEALKDPELVADKARISRLAGIIYDENMRLGNHIERVLSVARLEKKEIKLEFNKVNVNDLITAVADSMDLQLQKRDATVTLNLNATKPIILGDELHLSNVIYNLIDNANKYSINPPKITITTKSNTKQLYIAVSDEGIGMTSEQTKRIFDQFYRVPTGNLHDVKGFGLGLNYVQDMLTLMNGTVKVHSEKDKGTTFEITLPFKQNN